MLDPHCGYLTMFIKKKGITHSITVTNNLRPYNVFFWALRLFPDLCFPNCRFPRPYTASPPKHRDVRFPGKRRSGKRSSAFFINKVQLILVEFTNWLAQGE